MFIFQDMDVDKVMKTLDVNGDGFIELDEIAHVTGLKVGNPVLVDRFHKADTNGKDVQYARHRHDVFILEQGLVGWFRFKCLAAKFNNVIQPQPTFIVTMFSNLNLYHC